MDGGDRSRCHLVLARSGNELDARSSQGALARDHARLLPDEPGHPHDDEEEEDCGRDDENEHVGVAEGLGKPDPRGDQASGAEQGEPQRRQWGARIGSRLLEGTHGRVQRGCAPEEVVEDPAGVIDQLVVVGVLQECEVVGGVRRHQADDAADEEPERGRALAGVDRKTNGGSEQQDVAERVGDRHCVREQREVLEMDVRRNQEDPGEQADADRQDQRIDQCGPIRARASPSDEDRTGRP